MSRCILRQGFIILAWCEMHQLLKGIDRLKKYSMLAGEFFKEIETFKVQLNLVFLKFEITRHEQGFKLLLIDKKFITYQRLLLFPKLHIVPLDFPPQIRR